MYYLFLSYACGLGSHLHSSKSQLKLGSTHTLLLSPLYPIYNRLATLKWITCPVWGKTTINRDAAPALRSNRHDSSLVVTSQCSLAPAAGYIWPNRL